MKKILYITANPQIAEKSYSKRSGLYYLEELKAKRSVEVIELDVYNANIPLIDSDVLKAWGSLREGLEFTALSDTQQSKIAQMNANLAQFKEADEYIIVTPVWNFSIPPMLKAYIDNIMIAGQTFKYTEEGPIGLMGDKKVTIIQASGSVLSEGSMQAFNFASMYLEKVFMFMGITEINQIAIEGIAIPGPSDEERFSKVYAQIDTVLAE